jgi:Domain of unknown function (DUF4129)
MLQMSKKHCLVVVVLAAFFLCPAKIAAVPIADYHRSLKEAITALDTLDQLDDGESITNYETRFYQTVEIVRAAFPQNQTVESEGDVYNVDSSWLHKGLDELKVSVDRPEKIKQLSEILHAIETRVAERQDPGRSVESKDQAKSKLETILARPEYVTGARGPNALTRLLQDFARWIRSLLPKLPPMQTAGGATWIGKILPVLVVIAALLVIAFVVKVLLSRFKGSGKLKTPKKRKARIVLGERLKPEETATDLLSEAEALARSGDLRAAIRKAYIALLVELGDRKLISLAQHKTNRDYLNGLRNVPQLHSRMRGLTDSFERHWYGYAQATQNDWQDFRAGYVAALHAGK